MDQPIEGLIILIVTLACFVAGGLAALILRFRWSWPKGYVRTTGKAKGHKCTLLTPENYDLAEIDRKELARRCALVAAAMKESWQWQEGWEEDPKKLADVLDWTVCWFKTDEDFEKVVETWNRSYPVERPAAHTIQIGRKIGRGSIPGASIRVRYISMVYERAHPFEHELTHQLEIALLGTWDHPHAVPYVWDDFRISTVEAYQRMLSDS